MDEGKLVVQTTLEKEIQKSYLDYAMSVIVGRALPDVRDGLKPVHRRVMYAMYELKNDWNKPYKKSARIVGDTMGKYHPHGDSAIYDAIVRMAQDFSMRYTLVDGHGNFGSVDGDSAAASRYTEIRMSKLAHQLMADLEKDTVDFVPNYDNNETMPLIMPTRIPNLLVNGSSGIAVGMATNIPPHNLSEIIDACICLIDKPDATVVDLMEYVKGPDFPTAGIINGKAGFVEAYKTGRGKVHLRAKVEIKENEKSQKSTIIITELPYTVNKAKLCEKIGLLAREKKIEGITAIRDESNRKGMRVVIECRRGENAEVILNQLYTQTQMQVVYGINMVCLDRDRPKCLPLKDVLECFIEHRRDVVRRRLNYEVTKARRRVHILEGLTVAINNIDEVISLIRKAESPSKAKEGLLARLWSLEGFPMTDIDPNLTFLPEFDKGYGIKDNGYKLSQAQAQAILDLRLHRLTGLERERLIGEFAELVEKIKGYIELLEDFTKFMALIREELVEVKESFGDERRTEIIDNHQDLNDLDLIKDEPVVVTKSNHGYLKSQSVEEYKVQARGGRGKSAGRNKEDDFIDSLVISMRHEDLLCFTNIGRVYKLPVRHLPLAGRSAKGRPANNYLPLMEGERIQKMLPVRHYSDDLRCVLSTKKGMIKKVTMQAFNSVRSSGIIAINMKEDDELIAVNMLKDDEDIMLFSDAGKAIRFAVSEIRQTGRTSQGVRGMKLKDKQCVIAAVALKGGESGVLVATKNGYGKRTDLSEFRRIGRGGQGVIAMQCSERNGPVVSVVLADDGQDFFLITDSGIIIRMEAKSVSIIGRNTQGVKLVQMEKGSCLVACQSLDKDLVEQVEQVEHEVSADNPSDFVSDKDEGLDNIGSSSKIEQGKDLSTESAN